MDSKIINNMQEKVDAMMAKRKKLEDKVVEFDNVKAEDTETIKELETQLEAVKDEQQKAVDYDSAKQAKDKYNEINEKLTLQKGVAINGENQKKVEIEELVQELLDVHTEARNYYKKLEYNAKTTVCLQTLDADKKTLSEIAGKINGALNYSKNILLDFKLIESNGVNSYNGKHINAMPLHTDLERLYASFVVNDFHRGNL